tara:strand:- start:316 stop:1155 length:840 start_codon:yes stop_codon:yes gene_type:complete
MKLIYFSFLVTLIFLSSCQNTYQKNTHQPNLVFAVSDFSTGKNRVAFGIIDPVEGSLTPKNVNVQTYFLDGNPNELIDEKIADSYLWPNNKTIFVTELNFHSPGKWGIGINISEKVQTSAFIEVKQKSSTPNVGEKAISSITKTTTKLQELQNISSDPNPYLPFYKMTLTEALNSKKPTVLFFTSPGYCKTATCGPQMQIMKKLHKNIPNINFLHVEVYDNPNEIQGNLKNALISQPILDWNLPSEPWTFLIDSNQIISSKFEGFISEDELLIHLKSLN